METFFTVHNLCIGLFFTIFLILSCPTTTSTTTTTTTTKAKPLVVELIHRDSPLSPFYDPNITTNDRAERALQISLNRHAYLSAKQSGASTDDITGEIMPDPLGALYLAKLSIGTPPIEGYYVLDTGSDLLWTQCQPCLECYDQPGPIYDPKKSSTYRSSPCDSPICKSIPIKNRGCQSPNTCTYNYEYYKYGDGAYSNGTIGYEDFRVTASDGKIVVLNRFGFGCGNKNRNTVSGADAGILGLSGGGISLISQLPKPPVSHPKFSYCVPNISDVNAKGSFVLGNGSFIRGFKTPMTVGSNGLYYLNVDGINVRDKRLNIEPGAFDRRPDGTGGLVIDSATPYMLLQFDVYVELNAALYEELKPYELTQVPDPSKSYRLCFEGELNTALPKFPATTFIFKEDVRVELYAWHIFVQATNDVFCLAIHPVGTYTMSVFGTLGQQFRNIGYDLETKRVSFEVIDCSVL